MILRLLKSLQITARRHIQATSLDVKYSDTDSVTAGTYLAATFQRSLNVPCNWKTFTVCSLAALAISTTSVQAQQFQEPRLPAGYADQVRASQTGYSNESAVVNSRNSVPEYQQPVAAPRQYRNSAASSTRSYQPPVHIIPGPQNARPANHFATRQTSGPVVNLSDRNRAVLPTPMAGKPTPAVRTALAIQSNDQRVAQRASVPARQGFQVKGRESRVVRQTSMQEPFQDPFGDSGFSEPEMDASRLIPHRSQELDLRQNGFAAEASSRPSPSLSRPRSSQPLPKQVSILSGSGQETEGDARFDSFEFSQDSDANHGIDLPQEPTLGLERPLSRPFDQPASTRAAKPAQGGRFDEGELRQGLEDRLNNLMEETENKLRGRESNDDSLEEMPPGRGTRSLLDLDEQDDDFGNDERKRTPLDKSCQEFRNQLLDNPIRDIPLDMSPPVSENRDQYTSISRTWTDQSGNVIATGGMVDLRRGYVVLDNGQRIAFFRLSEADIAAVAEHWRTPITCSPGNRGSVCRNWIPQTYTWTATSLCHKPLYFENIQLERYGHSHGPFTQPVQSVAHFFVSLATLPYQTSLHPANECQYALGFYRPGDCAPWLKNPVPISLDGMRRQALVTTGLAFIP